MKTVCYKNVIHVVVVAVLILFSSCFSSCHRHHNHLLGDWATVETYTDHNPVGFQLSKGGMAASINQPTIQYDQWSLRRHELVLSGKRFENNQLVAFGDTLRIVKNNGNDLWVSRGTRQEHYRLIQ